MHRGTAGRLPHVRARTASAACARCAPWGALGPWTCGDWCRLAGPGSRIEPPAGAGCAAALPAQTIGVDDPPAAGASGRAQWHEMPPRVRRRGAARAPLSWWAGLRWNRRCSRRWGGGTARASAVTSPPPPNIPRRRRGVLLDSRHLRKGGAIPHALGPRLGRCSRAVTRNCSGAVTLPLL